jgi:hypothetical protein
MSASLCNCVSPGLLGITPNPSEHFVIKNIALLKQEQFVRIVREAGNSTALIFVHGFNTTFEDGIYRLAQIVWDMQFKGVPILFSWPSYGSGDGIFTGIAHYSYDQNSALDSRDGQIGYGNQLAALGEGQARTALSRALNHEGDKGRTRSSGPS